MEETNWIVITGPPCSGKSKVLERLSFLGYKVYPEVSRILIDNHTSNNINIEEYLKNKKDFEQDILSLKLQLEKRTNKNDIYFFDRGMIDSFAFIKFYNVELDDFDNYLNYRYKKVFFLEPVPYEKDKNRFENYEQSKQLANELQSAYKKYKYSLVNVPLMPIDKRVELIIKNI
ncbi:AAA family ATPase [Saccharicrinis sp. FJH2]|uniref:AAA family ATPase n=1 Tax=Saccharicrinis sp. FJH65 TaxID=3344659 RepID=UPI0035F49E5B